MYNHNLHVRWIFGLNGLKDIPIAALTVFVKKEAMNVHLNNTDIDDGCRSDSGSEDVKDEDEDGKDVASIDAYCKYHLFLHLIMLIIS